MTLKIEPSSYYDQENGGRIPIFTPTWDEFKDFKSFVESIEEHGKRSGIVKIIPPEEWKSHTLKIKPNLIKNIKVTKPITQHIIGGRGIFTQTNIEDRKEYSLQQWYDVCQQDQHRPHFAHVKAKRMCCHAINSTITLQQEKNQNDDHSVSFESNLSHLTTDDYKEIERHYWRNITFNQPMYGADMLGTLFDPSVTSWNPNTLDNTLNKLNQTLPGVNSPYLYFGMWKATFAWHVEDMDLYSINYIHFGAPKQWYVIQPCHQRKFETFMQTTFFTQYKDCHEFLRHKTFIVSPKVLENNNIPVQRCVQQPGEFIITYPFGYHSGYNLDFNCAESVNFAMDSWLEIGRKAKSCTCIDDSVVIDVNTLLSDSNSGHKEAISIIGDDPPPKVPSTCLLCSGASIKDALLDTNYERHTKIHQLCAEAVDETYVLKKVVYGVENIPVSRWKLVCLYCKQRVGACMQCCYGKCWKSFHATCAVKHGATMNRIHKDPSNPHSLYDGYCPQHDPKQINKRKLQKEMKTREMIEKFRVGLDIYTKWRGGGYYKGTIKECLPTKKMCCVLMNDGITRKVSWRDIVFETPKTEYL